MLPCLLEDTAISVEDKDRQPEPSPKEGEAHHQGHQRDGDPSPRIDGRFGEVGNKWGGRRGGITAKAQRAGRSEQRKQKQQKAHKRPQDLAIKEVVVVESKRSKGERSKDVKTEAVEKKSQRQEQQDRE